MIAKDGKLTIPTLGVGGRHGIGDSVAARLARVAANVSPAIVPAANRWATEEKPADVENISINFPR